MAGFAPKTSSRFAAATVSKNDQKSDSTKKHLPGHTFPCVMIANAAGSAASFNGGVLLVIFFGGGYYYSRCR